MEKIKVHSVTHKRNPRAGELTQDGFKELKGMTIISASVEDEDEECEDEDLFDNSELTTIP